MAKIQEEIVVVKLSRLIKDGGSEPQSMLNEEIQQALEQVVQELVGDSIVVEIEKA